MRTLAVLLIALALPMSASAEPPGGLKQVDFVVASCAALAINTAKNCEISDGAVNAQVWGWSTVTVTMNYTKGNGTGFTFHLEQCDETAGAYSANCTDATDWKTVSIVAPSGSTTTLSNETIDSGTMAASGARVVSMGINYRRLRLASILASGTPNSSDKITANVVLSRGQ